MNKVVPRGYLVDSQGRLVQEDNVKEIDKVRDALVREIVKKAQELSQSLAAFKEQTMADIDAFVQLSAEKYNVKRGGRKGNLSLPTYDGEYKVVVANADHLVFDERLHAAKELIDACLHDWTETSHSALRTIVDDVFQVDKTGNLNKGRILSLRAYEIDDERWKNAMKAINDSLQIVGSKSYIRIYKRQEDGSYTPINLDIAVL